MSSVGTKAMSEAMDVAAKNITKQLEGATKISKADKDRLDELKKERITREKNFSAFQKEVGERELLIRKNKALGKEMSEEDKKWREDALQQFAKFTADEIKYNEQRGSALKDTLQSMQKSTDEAYTHQREQIMLKYALEEQTIRNTYDMTVTAENNKVEVVEKSMEDITALNVAQNVKLQDMEERKNNELKKNEEDHQKASASVLENFLKERTSGLEKYVDNTTKTTKKNAEKVQKELGSLIEGVDETVIESVVKQSAEQQKAATATAAATTTATTATTAATAATTASTAATTAATAATNQAADATKKYLDIQATRVSYQSEIEELKKLQEEKKKAFDAQIKQYDDEIAAAKGNQAAIEEINKRKAATIKQYATDIILIQQYVTSTEKKQQDLGAKQWEQYTQKIGEINSKVQKSVGKVTDYLKQGFTAVGKMYEAQVNAINEELNILVEKDSEAYAKGKTSMANIAALEKEKTAAKESGNAKAVEEIQKKIDAEEAGATKEIEIAKNRDAKEAELKKEKEKIESRQRKADRLLKRVELVKSIAEATANVAQAVTKTMAAYPFPFNIALAATVGIAGALQIKAMAAQLTKFEDGGLLRGKRHSQGGMRIEGSNIEVEGGEYVVNRESTSRNLGLVRYINSERRELKPADLDSFFSRSSRGFEPSFSRIMQNGGQLPVAEPTNNIDNETLVQAIRSIRIEPRVAVSDIHRVQDSMVSVDSWTGV